MKWMVGIIIVVLIGLYGWWVYANNSHHAPESVATQDITQALSYREQLIKSQKQLPTQFPSLQRDTKEHLREMTLVTQYANAHDISVTDKEVSDTLSARASAKGKTVASLLEDVKSKTGMDQATYQQALRYEILKQKVQKDLKRPIVEWLAEQMKGK